MPLSTSDRNYKDTSYLGNRQQCSCDILLKLDDGNVLPAHSQVLESLPVFSGMVEEGLLSRGSATNDVSVPFTDCSVEEACRFLSAVYSCDAKEHITDKSALSIARLSNKYGEEVSIYAENGASLFSNSRHGLGQDGNTHCNMY